MGAQPTRLKTQAETQLAAQFAALGKVSPERAQAFARFEAQGLPHRRIEAWHFTDLRAALREALPVLGRPQADAIRAARLRLGVARGTCRLVVLDGHFIAELSSPAPEGVVIGPQHNSTPKPAPDDAMADLVAAFWHPGVAVRVEDGVSVEGALEILYMHSQATPSAIVSKGSVDLGLGASLTLLETYAEQGSANQMHCLTMVQLAAGAKMAHVASFESGTGVAVLTQDVVLQAHASYDSFALLTGGQMTRRQVFLKFAGAQSKAALNGVTLVRHREHIDTTLLVDHAASHCISRETFRHIIDDEATGVFQGKIIVRPGAQKTDGKMMSKAVLLAQSAVMNNKPELEIFADDVVCGHGATVGALDDDQLFYAQARGIPKQEAEALLLEAFAGEVIDTISDQAVASSLREAVTAWLAGRKA